MTLLTANTIKLSHSSQYMATPIRRVKKVVNEKRLHIYTVCDALRASVVMCCVVKWPQERRRTSVPETGYWIRVMSCLN